AAAVIWMPRAPRWNRGDFTCRSRPEMRLLTAEAAMFSISAVLEILCCSQAVTNRRSDRRSRFTITSTSAGAAVAKRDADIPNCRYALWGTLPINPAMVNCSPYAFKRGQGSGWEETDIGGGARKQLQNHVR